MPKHPSPDHQPELLPDAAPEARAEKEKYRERLRAYLRDPEFRQTPGFPIGDDDAILALSDPPYYTACPNPFLPEIIEQWQKERRAWRVENGYPDDDSPRSPLHSSYHREPFAADVSEGKNDPIYNAHSYHTKVPHKAIMRYILHYTDPGDVVMDGFCGTGMTGVAAQLCGDRKEVESLGYYVNRKGEIFESAEAEKPFSHLGARKAVLVDLSPAATFIAYNYNTPVDAKAFEREAKRILKEVEEECGWMYETWHPHCEAPNRVKGIINYTVWSDVFLCPQCGAEMVFWDVAVDDLEGKVRDDWPCPQCGTALSKNPRNKRPAQRVERALETKFDTSLRQAIQQAKQVPVIVNYSVDNIRFEKTPDEHDFSLFQKIESSEIPYSIPINRMPDGDESRRNDDIGLTHVHHFYSRRNLWVLAALWRRASNSLLKSVVTSVMQRASKQHQIAISRVAKNKIIKGGKTAGHRRGTLYVPSNQVEFSVFELFALRLSIYEKAILTNTQYENFILSNQSSHSVSSPSSTIDYLFIDPPFGDNLMYSELNFLWEAWLRVLSKNQSEAIINKTQHKGMPEYQDLMTTCFCECYRLLKSGHWITVEFHNSQNAVWNSIQEALLQSGFMVADVRTLDKQKKTHTQVTATGSVNQDLVISAYKPRADFEQRFQSEGGSLEGAWSFIRQHLEQLPPPPIKENGFIETLAERQAYLLYDRMVAFHIQRGLTVPLSAPEFYAGLRQRFLDRDEMYFTPVQAAEYDKRRLKAERVEQLSLFVNDEKSALQWIRRQLNPETGPGPQTYQDLQPNFLKELHHQASHEKMPELRTMLEGNFLQDAAGRWYLPDPDKQADLDALRLKALLKEFNEYRQVKGKLKTFRSEAIRAGFSHAWREKDFGAIVEIAERLPASFLEEEQQLHMYVRNAQLVYDRTPKQRSML